ncbi:MAG: glycoside hydrolase [Bacteroidales bacterium]|nr:glycoside hydrolase [Bacteroidales bacterium]
MRKILISLLCLTVALVASAKDYNASLFGIKSNGTTLNTTSIQKAIDFISAEGGGKLIFKVGRYLTGTIELKDNVTIELGEGAVLVGSTNPYDYYKKGDAFGLVISNEAENIAITGLGVIDGQGRELANNFLGQIAVGAIKDLFTLGRPHDRPHLLYLCKSKNVTLQGINLRNSSCWTCTTDRVENLLIDGVTLDSRAFWNNDGFDIVDCTHAVIQNCFVNATDDGICLKSHHKDVCNDDVVVRHNTITSSASGIKFGTFGVGGFRNIQILDNVVYDTFRSAITIQSVDGGFAENILVDGLKSYNTANAIYLNVGQRRGDKPSRMENITIRNLYAEIPVDKPDYGVDYEGPTLEDQPRNVLPCGIVGLEGQPIRNVTIENVEIHFPGGGDPSFAKVGTYELEKVPEMPTAYPEFSQYKELPAWGFYVRHAKGIHFHNVTLTAAEKDYRPAIVLDDVQGASFTNLKATAPKLKTKIFVARNCGDIKK